MKQKKKKFISVITAVTLFSTGFAFVSLCRDKYEVHEEEVPARIIIQNSTQCIAGAPKQIYGYLKEAKEPVVHSLTK